jgi:predicted dehydrogenase
MQKSQNSQKEASLPIGERIDFVTIVTQNNLHCKVAKVFLEAGINVICDKPLGISLAEGKELREVVKKSSCVFALTHNYTGYPMVKEAKAMVKAGKLGEVIKIVVEYPQGYAANAFEEKTSEIANWRMDPRVTGISNCIGDIGTHAENLAHYISGLDIDEVAAELSTFIKGRPLDDDGNMLVRYKGGARGILFASQVSVGEENGINIRVYGKKGSIEWHQEEPNELLVKYIDQPRQIYRRGNSYNSAAATKNNRLPSGHPEGFIEAFANIYLAAAEAIIDKILGKSAPQEGYDFPSIDDGITGMAFVEAAVASSKNNTTWIKLDR